MKRRKGYDSKKYIIVEGAKLHNLKNVSLSIPRNKITVFTGLSGSGKSSLAFDTLYAEGQRRYVESLSSYARQFMGKLNKPKVDKIIGISPAIAIEQKINTSNPRSTVGTKTEIYEYLKLLFGRIGDLYSPETGQKITKNTTSDVINYIEKFDTGSKILLLSPIEVTNNDTELILKYYQKQGFVRIFVDGDVKLISEIKNPNFKKFDLIIERIICKNNFDYEKNLAESIELSFINGNGFCKIYDVNNMKSKTFINFYSDGKNIYPKPTEYMFSFNNPYGACEKCQGYGDLIDIDPDLVVPNKSLSIYENAILPWKGQLGGKYYKNLITNSSKFKFPIHRPFYKLSESEKQLLWEGNKYFNGINHFFNKIKSKSYKIQNRVMLSRYRGKTKCDSCKGSRLKKIALSVKINHKNINELCSMSLTNLKDFFEKLKLNSYKTEVSKRILKEIKNRIELINNLGLGYLNLNRKSNSLSGGESQRINIATSIGSSLVGSMYILDEPSIGLHPRDTNNLIKILNKLRDIGNTVIVVEHDEEIIRSSDNIIDMGKEAGINGGDIVASGNLKQIMNSDSLTSKYLNEILKIDVPTKRNKNQSFFEIKGLRENNLKNINVKIPLNIFTVITGVSGSGKSTLIKKIIYPAVQRELNIFKDKPGDFDTINGNISKIKQIEYIDQNPIGKSSRSNPVTYIKAYDEIRKVFSNQKLSKLRGLKPKHFSFNVPGGRCEKCQGEGSLNIEMQFMADVKIVCDECNGKRFKKEILEIYVRDKSINDILNLSINEAIDFFNENNNINISQKLLPLQKVGLGYILLGQSSSTLSGGEAQRVKLAYFLQKVNSKNHILFLFDEPTTGLHFHDIKILLKSFKELLGLGHTLVVVEHNIDLIKCADNIIDLGPEGGENGGYIVAQGTPEDISKNKESLTGYYLKKKL